MKRQTKAETLNDLVNGMFIAAGYNLSIDDVRDSSDNWFDKYTWTKDQQQDFTSWAIDYMKRKLNYSTREAARQVSWFILGYGLRVKYPQTETDAA